jgi:hypothetical protein
MPDDLGFEGFALPENVYFPAELRSLLPFIDTLSELKVLLIILDAYFQAGLDAQPLSFDEIQDRTGLSRYGANEGLKRGRIRGTVERTARRGIYHYAPSLNIRLHDHEHDSLSLSFEESDSKTHDHGESEFFDLRKEVYEKLVSEFGVSKRVADDIAWHRDPLEVAQQMDYARYEIGAGFRPSNPAGFVVARIRDDDPPPLGYQVF